MATALGLSVANIIDTSILTDPMQHGIGAGLTQNKKTSQTIPVNSSNKQKQSSDKKNTSSAVLNKTAQSITVTAGTIVTDIVKTTDQAATTTVNETTIGDLTRILITGGKNESSIADLANMMMKKSVDQILNEEIKKGKIKLQTSELGTTYATAKAYYKKLYDGDKILTDLRNKTEKNISKSINQKFNDTLKNWQDKLPEWQKNILIRSKLASSLQNYVSTLTKNCINNIFGDSVIKNWNDALVKNLNKIKDTLKTKFNETFKGGIEYYKKLRKAIADKIKLYTEMKQKFEQHITSIINEYKNKIAKAVSEFTTKLVNSITSSIKTAIGSIKL